MVDEWQRVRREVESLWKGAWQAIHDLDDRLRKLEHRVDRIEQTHDELPARTRVHTMIKKHLPGLDLDENED